MTTLDQRLERKFQNAELLVQAFTHRSFHNENPTQSKAHNERLEFLGDAVLDLALTDYLMRTFPDLSEGDLSKMRASLVNESVLAELAKQFKLDQKLRLGKGESSTGGAQKPRLLASVLEAFIGAYYLDAGFVESQNLVEQLFENKCKEMDLSVHFSSDYKTRLQELMQNKHGQPPTYSLVGESGPDHDKVFIVAVKVGDQILAQGEGKSKKQAEQSAAQKALEVL